MVGAFSGNLHVLKAALDRGVRADAKDHSGKTAMDFAKKARHAEVIAFLESFQAPKPAAEAPAAGAGATPA
jgi:ankyrin repeat protein